MMSRPAQLILSLESGADRFDESLRNEVIMYCAGCSEQEAIGLAETIADPLNCPESAYALASLAGYALKDKYAVLEEQKRLATKHVVESAHGALVHFHALETSFEHRFAHGPRGLDLPVRPMHRVQEAKRLSDTLVQELLIGLETGKATDLHFR